MLFFRIWILQHDFLVNFVAKCSVGFQYCTGPVRFAEKISRNTVLADLLWEKNTVSVEKSSRKRRIMFGLCVVFYIWTAIYLCYYIAIVFLYIIIIIKNEYSVA